ncbi:MAG TPA: wax ester/triacylglycerol synthase family O-acyltransferase [Solirubrobacteraceae bacterium]|jgi:WS/DGAT/MGAT family acyltransferase|nr:wax ester/triacylglycerol synthase family O-acyltransferase [Solirubrobacteraceae bacterium]
MPTTARSRLSPLDAAFLAIESEHAPMHVGWAALFAAPEQGPRPRFDAIRAHVEGRLGRAPRYRQKLAEIPLGLDDPVWVDDPHFDIALHVRRARERDFGALVDEVMSAPLEHDRALWELWIAEGLDDGHIGVVGKAHHCLVDGLAAVELMALLLDLEQEPQADPPHPWTASPGPSPAQLVGGAVAHHLGQAFDLVRAPLAWARDPRPLLELPDRALRAALATAHTIMPPAPPSPINGPMAARRHLACHTRALSDLRRIKERFGTTVNDVLLSASAGALRGLLEQRQEQPRGVKAMVPVSITGPDERWGNGIAFLFLVLPCEETDPVWRLREIHVAMRERKRAREPEGSGAVLDALGYTPRRVRRVVSRVLASAQVSNLTISNIPGPQVPLYLMGCEAKQAYPVVPLSEGHGLSIGMTTVGGQACFGVYAQAELADDAELIARGIGEAIEELLARC